MHEIDKKMYEGMKKHLVFLKDSLAKAHEVDNPYRKEEYKSYLENAIERTASFLKQREEDYKEINGHGEQESVL